MKRVALYRWHLSNPDMPHQKRSLTSWAMPEAAAKAMDPTAEPWGEPEWREIAEPGDPPMRGHSTGDFK